VEPWADRGDGAFRIRGYLTCMDSIIGPCCIICTIHMQ